MAEAVNPNSAEIQRIVKLVIETTGADPASKSLDNVGKSAEGVGKRADATSLAVKKLSSHFKELAAFGGVSIGLEHIIEKFLAFEKDVISISGAMSKYGVGVTKVEDTLHSLSDQLNVTRKDTADLFKAYERGMPFATFKGASDFFASTRCRVGVFATWPGKW